MFKTEKCVIWCQSLFRHSRLFYGKNCMHAFAIRPTFTTIIMMNSLSDMLLQNASNMKNTLATISIKRTVCALHISHVNIVLKSYYFIFQMTNMSDFCWSRCNTLNIVTIKIRCIIIILLYENIFWEAYIDENSIQHNQIFRNQKSSSRYAYFDKKNKLIFID